MALEKDLLRSWDFSCFFPGHRALQLIKHYHNTASVAPPPAGPALYFLHLMDLSLRMWIPNRCCILQLSAYQSVVLKQLFKLS